MPPCATSGTCTRGRVPRGVGSRYCQQAAAVEFCLIIRSSTRWQASGSWQQYKQSKKPAASQCERHRVTWLTLNLSHDSTHLRGARSPEQERRVRQIQGQGCTEDEHHYFTYSHHAMHDGLHFLQIVYIHQSLDFPKAHPLTQLRLACRARAAVGIAAMLGWKRKRKRQRRTLKAARRARAFN